MVTHRGHLSLVRERPADRGTSTTSSVQLPGYRPLQGNFGGECEFCHAPVLWLRHPGTNRLAPVDVYPSPDGNVVVDRDERGFPTGTYAVIYRPPAPRTRGGVPGRVPFAPDELEDLADAADVEESAVADPTLDPTMHLNHFATCTNRTHRRLAQERARVRARGGMPGPPRTIDGELVGQRWDEVERSPAPPSAAPGQRPDATGSSEAAAPQRRCRRCFQPLSATESNSGRYHPTCDPDGGFS
jgi:hypothetical protein